MSAVTRIFYGDYELVSVRSLLSKAMITCNDAIKIVNEIPQIQFSETEIEAIQSAKSPGERSSILCTLMVAHVYEKMGILKVDPKSITPENLEANLSLGEHKYIQMSPVREGPVAHGDPPFLSKLV